jgi:GxxExxY protein
MNEENIAKFPDLGSELTGVVIGAALEVHKQLGPGLLESVYESCLHHELESLGLGVEKQVVLPVIYKGKKIDQGFRIDLWVDKKVIIEVKACDKILPVHEAQLVTYLKLSRTPLGLILNFNERVLKDGIRRLIRAEFAENPEKEKSEHQR